MRPVADVVTCPDTFPRLLIKSRQFEQGRDLEKGRDLVAQLEPEPIYSDLFCTMKYHCKYNTKSFPELQ